jgi:hypothetical protein
VPGPRIWHTACLGRIAASYYLCFANVAQGLADSMLGPASAARRQTRASEFGRGAVVSIIGILSSNLFSAGAAHNAQNNQSAQSTPSTFQQITAEFQQLGQDLQTGKLTQAQQDFTTLSQNFPGASQTSNNPLLQALTQLGKDLQAGNLQAAQQDYTTVVQDAQQIASQVGGHHGHHRHHAESSQSTSSSSQQANPIAQAFSALAQDLQSGNLSGAQSAFAALTNDLQQIGGFVTGGSNGASGTAVPSSAGSLNVSA